MCGDELAENIQMKFVLEKVKKKIKLQFKNLNLFGLLVFLGLVY